LNPVEYLYSLELHGIKLGLENIRRLMDGAGHPEAQYTTVHVGGTNGKGSVVALLDAMLRAAGFRTGRFTSPHLISVRERFLVNRELIPAGDLDRHIEFFRDVAAREGIIPTFFELCTAIGFRHFAERRVDVGLIEVGMGGRFDSTNIIHPEAAVITNISLEHTKYLGDTLEKIAFEKAGIIKAGVPLILGESQDGPANVIFRRARELGAPVRQIGRDFKFSIEGSPQPQRFSYSGGGLELDRVPLGLAGPYQRFNAALAVTAALELRPACPALDAQAIEAGLAAARWPCRLERVLRSPEVIIDVAHNAAGAQELARALPGPCIIVLAVSSDKDVTSMIAALAPRAHRLILTQFDGPRALPVAALGERAHALVREEFDSLPRALERGIAEATDTGLPLIITGSLFTAGQARRILIDEYGAAPIEF
jgi:dihydrofolate synthase/folylpolyglutamate synthase